MRHPLLLALGIFLTPLAAGCIGQVNGGGGGSDTTSTTDTTGTTGTTNTDTSTTGTTNGTACDLSNEGKPCANEGDTCFFGDECGGEELECSSDHVWVLWYVDSNDPQCMFCPEAVCPPASDVPWEGRSCDPCYDLPSCHYDLDSVCGPQTVDATCGDDLAWHVTANPPCDCKLHDSLEDCQADANCRYLTAGCGDPALVQEGCYPKTDCGLLDSQIHCHVGQGCAPYDVDSCDGEGCAQCVAVHVCLD